MESVHSAIGLEDQICFRLMLRLLKTAEVNISSRVGRILPTRIFFVVLKYSNQGFLCKNIQIRVFCAEILVRYRCALPSHAQLTIDQTKAKKAAPDCTAQLQ